MSHIVGLEWIAAIMGALLIGISKTGLPGVGILAVPLFASILPARASTGAVLPMLILADICAVTWYRRHAVWPHLFRIMPWTVLGVVIGYLLLDHVSDRQLRPMIGFVVLAMLALNEWRTRRPGAAAHIPTNVGFAALIGILAGATTMMANAAGPIMIIYLLAMRLPKNEFVGTGAWYFCVLNLFKVPFSVHLGLINADSLLLNATLAIPILAGAALGLWLVHRIPEKPFTLAVQALAICGAVRLLFW
ncbi:MAG: sulfite exporter TauE/SafE family protein [Lentisphaerae bacterium]|nr:sulfite exporter TauE/SafE family protein [Lentisphaerota bacterium]